MMNNNLPSIREMIEALALISEDKDFLTRRYLTSQHKKVNELVSDWMSVAGMKAWQLGQDAWRTPIGGKVDWEV